MCGRTLRLFLGFLVCLPTLAWSADTYVSTSGTNGNGCFAGIGAPKRDIGAGMACLGPGDRLYIRGGTYNETLDDCRGTVYQSGTSENNRTIIEGYPGETVTIRAPSGSDFVMTNQCSQPSYMTFKNLHLDATNANNTAFKVSGSHILVVDSELCCSPTQMGILSGGSFNDLRNVDIHDNAEYGIYKTGDRGIMENLHIHHNGGVGLHLYNDSRGVDNNIFRNNRVHDNGFNMRNCFGGCIHPGIIVASGVNNLIYNNLIYHNGGVGIANNYDGDNSEYYNNTVYDNGAAQPDGCFNMSNSLNATFRNNICYANTGGDTLRDETGTLTASNNLIGTNPQFVNAGAFDFHIQSGSPAINAGVTVSAVSTDFDGTTRPPGAYDIGAYEFGGGPPPPPPPPGPLIAHWQFETVSGATTPDASGNGYTLTLNGGPTLVSGKVGTNAMSFASVGSNATLPSTFTVSTYSWAFWLNMPTASREDVWEICMRDSPEGVFGMGWSGIIAGHKPRAFHADASGTVRSVYALNALQANVWYHFAATWDGTTLRFYLNGTLQNTGAFTGIWGSPTGQFTVNAPGETCKGIFDDMRIYNTVLTGSEIAAMQPVATGRTKHRAMFAR